VEKNLDLYDPADAPILSFIIVSYIVVGFLFTMIQLCIVIKTLKGSRTNREIKKIFVRRTLIYFIFYTLMLTDNMIDVTAYNFPWDG
jgi:hypothetical protein